MAFSSEEHLIHRECCACQRTDDSPTRPDGECQRDELGMNKNSGGTCNGTSFNE